MTTAVTALVKEALDGPDWLHEIKLDGYRMHARLDAGRVNILTRRGNDWTAKYPTIAAAIAGLRVQNAYLDGELCGVASDGRSAFNDGGGSDATPRRVRSDALGSDRLIDLRPHPAGRKRIPP